MRRIKSSDRMRAYATALATLLMRHVTFSAAETRWGSLISRTLIFAPRRQITRNTCPYGEVTSKTPSWLRRISAGFKTSTVPLTISIIASPNYPNSEFVEIGDAINRECRTDYNTDFFVFLIIEKKGFMHERARTVRIFTLIPLWPARAPRQRQRCRLRRCVPLSPLHAQFLRVYRSEPR